MISLLCRHWLVSSIHTRTRTTCTSLFHFFSPWFYLRWEERSAFAPAQHSFASEFPPFWKRIWAGAGRDGACGRWGERKQQQQQQWDRPTKARFRKRQDQTPPVVQRDAVSPLKRMLWKRGEGHQPGLFLFLPSILPTFFPSLLPYFLPLFQSNGI